MLAHHHTAGLWFAVMLLSATVASHVLGSIGVSPKALATLMRTEWSPTAGSVLETWGHRIGRLATARHPSAARVRNRLLRMTPESVHNRRLARYASASTLDAQMTC